MTSKRIIVALTCALLLAGCTGAPKPTPQQPPEPEPVDGETTVKTDPNAPKVIESKDIEDLFVSFYLNDRWTEEDAHDFRFRVARGADGSLVVTEELSGASVPADEGLLAKLQEIVDAHGLASMNGVYESNMSLSPEYQGCSMQVSYASGESLNFTVINNPWAEWAEAFYDVLAAWFAEQGDESLYPAEETSQVSRLRLDVEREGTWYSYGGINVTEDNAIEGERYLLERDVYDVATQEREPRGLMLFPDDYYERVTEILGKYDIVRRYDFSRYDHAADNYGNHDEGYFGWGNRPEGEEDSEDLLLMLHIEYESGTSVYIETRKASEIEAMEPLVAELIAYHDSLFA